MTPEEIHKRYRDRNKEIIRLSNGLFRYGIRIHLNEIRNKFDYYYDLYENLKAEKKAGVNLDYPQKLKIQEYQENKKKLFSDFKETLEQSGIDTKKITFEKAKNIIFGEIHPEQFEWKTPQTKKQIFENSLQLAKQSIQIAHQNINL